MTGALRSRPFEDQFLHSGPVPNFLESILALGSSYKVSGPIFAWAQKRRASQNLLPGYQAIGQRREAGEMVWRGSIALTARGMTTDACNVAIDIRKARLIRPTVSVTMSVPLRAGKRKRTCRHRQRATAVSWRFGSRVSRSASRSDARTAFDPHLPNPAKPEPKRASASYG